MPNKITSKQGKEAFLEFLKEAHARFGMDAHAYYLDGKSLSFINQHPQMKPDNNK
ncbi:MAG: hypothetical protein ABW077_18005 [Candidatus Thiodiazotropha endolucinida]